MSSSWTRALTILLLTLTAAVAGLMVAAWAMLPLDQTALTIEGERFSLADLTGTHAVVFFVIAVAGVVFALLVALAAGALGLGLGVIGLAFGLAVAIGSLALVTSPFLFFVWLVWRFVRTRPAAPMVTRA